MQIPGIAKLIILLHCLSVATKAQDSWQLQKTNVNASLRGLCVVDSKVVWASGSEGTVLVTTDAGETWKNVSIKKAAELDFRDIQAFDEKNAVVLSAGQPARVYRTDDGGSNWSQSFEHPNKKSFFDALSFWDRKHGIAMSDPTDGHVLLIETRDGGKSWQELPLLNRPKAERGEGGFAASGTNMILSGERCLVALGSGEENQTEPNSRVVYSDDRSKTWKVASVPIQRNTSSGIFSIAMSQGKFGVAVGGNYLKPEIKSSNIAITNDGGVNWHKPEGRPPRGYRSSVAFVSAANEKHLVAVGPDGTDISTDGGKNWQAASDTGFHAVMFTKNDHHGWASGSDGRIAKWSGRFE